MKSSIKNQIIVAVLVSQLLLAVGLTLTVVLYSRAQLLAGFDIMLDGRIDSILAVVHNSENPAGGLVLDRSKVKLPGRDFFEVRDDTGKLIFRSQNWQGTPITGIEASSSTFEIREGASSYRGIVVRKAALSDADEDDKQLGPPKIVTIAYAASTRELDRRIFKIGTFAAGASLLLLLLAGWFAAHGVMRGLAPVQELASEASKVTAHNWSFTAPESARAKVELAPLVNALDTTLAGLQRAFDRERMFIADAAHELKTAVAILKSSLQLLICQPRSNEEYRGGLDRALEDCDRIEALVHNTLVLARAEQQADEQMSEEIQPVDLARNCERSICDMKPVAEARRIGLRCVVENDALVKANPENLHTVWTNLLQNSIQHSPAGSSVLLTVSTLGTDAASVVVEDRGSGIAPKELPNVFSRFGRGDPSRSRTTGGFGLGLSICKAIVESYGGRIEVESPVGAGTRVSVTLPTILLGSTSS